MGPRWESRTSGAAGFEELKAPGRLARGFGGRGSGGGLRGGGGVGNGGHRGWFESYAAPVGVAGDEVLGGEADELAGEAAPGLIGDAGVGALGAGGSLQKARKVA